MADVARLAGVSHQTVSRVLGDHPNVREETRARVLRAIEEMGYRRNSSARALVTRRTRTLGVVASDTTLYGPASTLFALEEAARAEGYLVLTVTLRELTMETLSEALDHLSGGGVEGVVTIAPQRSAVEALAELRFPFPVVVVGSGPGVDIPSVSVDQRLGARLATGHLLDAGHRNVWHLAGPEDWQEAADRAAGWRATLEAVGVEPPELLRGDWSPQSGYRAGQELAGWVDRGLTAVFVANDQMALGVLRAMHEYGRNIPREVSVVGFDDVPEAQYFTPPLTTVRQNFAEVGRGSLRLLLDVMRGGQSAQHLTVAPELVVRRSTAPPPDGR
jgi:DNA-binding LacI/PurR family transcriptional regulator